MGVFGRILFMLGLVGLLIGFAADTTASAGPLGGEIADMTALHKQHMALMLGSFAMLIGAVFISAETVCETMDHRAEEAIHLKLGGRDGLVKFREKQQSKDRRRFYITAGVGAAIFVVIVIMVGAGQWGGTN